MIIMMMKMLNDHNDALGYTEREALTALKDKIVSGSGAGVQFELLLSDLHDNYR